MPVYLAAAVYFAAVNTAAQAGSIQPLLCPPQLS